MGNKDIKGAGRAEEVMMTVVLALAGVKMGTSDITSAYPHLCSSLKHIQPPFHCFVTRGHAGSVHLYTSKYTKHSASQALC